MKHICIFLAFKNVEHIKLSFDSMSHDDVDFFIVENHSENSDEIYEYFKNKKLVGYIKFNENIAANAINIFIKNHRDLLLEYDYITMTDGDLFVYDIKETINEIRNALDRNICSIASSSLYMGNWYSIRNDNRLIGIEYYNDYMKNTIKSFGCVEGSTSGYLMTIRKKDLHLFENIHFIDSNILDRINNMGLAWYKTNKNLVYHLTWDLYVEGNEYFEWKKQVYPQIWDLLGDDFKYENKLINYVL